MKTRVFSLFCLMAFCLLLVNCNHEPPVNVISESYNIETVAIWNNDGTISSDVYLPATWCSEPPDDRYLPYLSWCFDYRLISQWEIQSYEPRFRNYYKYSITLKPGESREVVLTYGKYINPDNPLDISKANLANYKYNKFIKLYQPTDSRTDDEYVIAIRFIDGRFEEFNPNAFIPLGGNIVLSGELRVGKTIHFSIDNLQYTGTIGYKRLQWIFSDGYAREGESFDIKFDKADKNMFVNLNIIDNLGKIKTVRRHFSIDD